MSKSLIKFKKEFLFNINEFQYYVYKKVHEFSMSKLLATYELWVKAIIREILYLWRRSNKNNSWESGRTLFILFIAAAIEYKKYKEAEKDNLKYYTGFPITLDCSGSGPQIISLLLSDNSFKQYLNLTNSEYKYDFYIAIIKDFILKTPEINNKFINSEELELLRLLRKICKVNTMTQFYGVSFQKFYNEWKRLFQWNKKIMQKYLITIDYDVFVEEFIKSYWSYMHKLELFKLKSFFQYINKALNKKGNLSWEVFDWSEIFIDYKKVAIKQLDFKSKNIKRKKYNFLKEFKESNYMKQGRSSQANFIHSIDAFVNLYILNNYNKSIYSNHDCWSIGMGEWEELLKHLKEAYKIISKEGQSLLVKQFSELLEKIWGREAKTSFIKYCTENLNFNQFDIEWLNTVKYIAFFGT